MTHHVPAPSETPATTMIVVRREAHTPWPGMLETLTANTESRHLVRAMGTDGPEHAPRVLVFSRQLASPPRSGGALREIPIVRALAVERLA